MKTSQAALRESALRFRQIAENIREVFWLTDSGKSQMLYVSPAYETIWGRSCEELYAHPRSWLESIHPEDRERVSAAATMKQVSGEYNEEYRIVRPDGSIRWIRDRAFPVIDDDGTVRRIAGIAEDITEWKRLQQETERRMQIAEMLAALARTANEAEDLDHALRACLSILCAFGHWTVGRVMLFAPGNDEAKSVERSLWHVADPARFAGFMSVSDRLRYGIRPGGFITMALHERRSTWITDVTELPDFVRMGPARACGLRAAFAFPIIAGRTVAGCLEFFADEPRNCDPALLEASAVIGAQIARIIERRRAFDTLRESELRLRAILDNEPECVKVIAASGDLLEINRAGLDMLEADTLDRVRERGLSGFVTPEYRRSFADHLSRALAGEPNTLELQISGLRGTRRWIESHAARLDLPGEAPDTILVIARDLTRHRLAEERAEYLSRHDGLTGLPNRGAFRDRLEVAIAHTRRRGEVLGIMLINLDRLRKINEDLGFEAGDCVIRGVASRLRHALREVDTIACFGGDEFGVLVEGVTAAEDVATVAEKVNQALAAPFTECGMEIFVSAGIGIAVYPNGTSDPDALLQNAQIAMHRAKLEASDYQFYDETSMPRNRSRIEIESHLRHALERGEFTVHYQPKVNLLTGAITGAEALARWNNPDLGAVSPTQFIPIAEETGLIVPIGSRVLREACARLASWRRLGHDIDVAVNLSPRQFRRKELAQTIASVLAETGLAAGHLELEITEGTAMSRAEHTISVLHDLHQIGVKLAVDDFGTGYSSLAYLKRFPLHCLKIDRSFVSDLSRDPHSEAIVLATVSLAHSLGLRVVAEGIETRSQHDFLVRAGCDFGQGHLYSPALPADEFELVLKQTRNNER